MDIRYWPRCGSRLLGFSVASGLFGVTSAFGNSTQAQPSAQWSAKSSNVRAPYGTASLTVSSPPSDGDVPVQTVKLRTYTVTNIGNAVASSLKVTGLAAPWIRSGGTCGVNLYAGRSCTLIIAFSPLVAQQYFGTFFVKYFNGSLTKSISRSLQGRGIAAGGGGDGYLGMSLPADFKIFSAASPWNTPIATNAPFDPNSGLMMAKLQSVLAATNTGFGPNYKEWTTPMHVVDSDKALWKNVVSLDPAKAFFASVDPTGIGSVNFPLPDAVWQDPQSDGHMIVIDPVKRKVWELGAAVKVNGQWKAMRADTWDLDGTGVRDAFTTDRWWLSGVRAAGVPFMGGLVRVEELEAGVILHALSIATPINRLSLAGPADWGRWEVCNPVASNTDGSLVGPQYIPEGARLQLNPNLNLDALGFSREAKIIAKALQVYGAYNADNADGFPIYLQNLGPKGGKWNQYPNLVSDLEKIPVAEFRVLACNTAVLDLTGN